MKNVTSLKSVNSASNDAFPSRFGRLAIFCCLLLSRVLGGAADVQLVQSATAIAPLATNLVCALPDGPTNLNTLIAVIGASAPVKSITQVGANWVRATEVGLNSGVSLEVWYAPRVIGASNLLTINFDWFLQPMPAAAVVMEYSGLRVVDCLDRTNSAVGTGTNISIGITETTTQAEELWIGGIRLADNIPTLTSLLNSFSLLDTATAIRTDVNWSYKTKVFALGRVANAVERPWLEGELSPFSAGVYTGWEGVMATFKAFGPKAPSMVTESSSVNPSTVGRDVTFTATVWPGDATGTVTFKDGTRTLGTSSLAGGIATFTARGFTTNELAVGTHNITAAYGGDLKYDGWVNATPLVQTVCAGPTVTTLPAGEIGATSATLGGTVNPNGVPTDAFSEYTTNGNWASSILAGSFNGLWPGTGTVARFSYPAGLAMDIAGNTYVADSSNHVIRVITTNGMVTTLAGSGPGSPGTWDGTNLLSARFRCPSAVAVDTDRHGWISVYVSDTGNHRIRGISLPPPSSLTETSQVVTVAGSVDGFQDGDGSVAHFTSPRGIAVQAANEWGETVYVADTGNNRIRKIDRYGKVTTLAGTNTAGWSDGVGSLAQFNAPQGVAVDGAGNVFVADTGNHCIRKVTPSGVVTTLAGTNVAGWSDGVGAGARFKSPTGVAIDRVGSLVVADSGNHRIRLVTPLGIVNTLAGCGLSGFVDGVGTLSAFDVPTSVVLDDRGNIRLTDLYNHCIRELEYQMAPPVASTTVWTRLGGSSVMIFSNTITGLLPATTYYHRAVGVNVPKENGLTMSFWTKGRTTTSLVASTNFAAVGTSVGLTSIVATVDSQTPITGTVTFKDGTNILGTVALAGGRAVLDAGNLVTGWRGITAEYSGDANYAASGSSPAVEILMCNAPVPSTLAATDVTWTNATVSGLVNASHLATGAFIQYSTNAGGWNVTTLAGTYDGYGAYRDGTGGAARFYTPRGVAVDRSNNVYVADSANHCIRKISPLGVVTTLAGTNNSGASDGLGRAARFNWPAGVSVDYAGNVWVAEGNLPCIRKITQAGLVTTFAGMLPGFGTNTDGYLDAFAGEARFHLPSGVVVDNDINLFVADSGNQRIRGITAAGMVRTLAGTNSTGFVDGAGSLAMFNNPFGVALDKLGNVIVADLTNNCIRKVTQEGVVTTLAGDGSAGWADGIGSAAKFYHPCGVAVDYDGNIYVADRDNFRIRRIDTAGFVTTVAGTNSTGTTDGIGSAAKFNRPTGVAVDSGRNLYVSDSGNHTIRKLVSKLGATVVSLPAQTGFTGSNDLAISNVITGLLPYTTYYFRVVVTNSAGTNYGDTHSFTTTPPPEPVHNCPELWSESIHLWG